MIFFIAIQNYIDNRLCVFLVKYEELLVCNIFISEHIYFNPKMILNYVLFVLSTRIA